MFVPRKGISVNINKSAKEVSSAWKDYKKGNPLILKKSFSMKDSVCRKNSPSKELWHTEVSFNVDQYLVIVASILLVAWLFIMCRRFSRRLGRCRHKKHS